jgi:hypothetical protein
VFGREALLNILACLATLLASECSVPVATTIQLNIIFVLADGLDVATARQLPALGLVLAEKGASFENAFVEYSIRCVDLQATILISLYSHRRAPYLHRAIMPGDRRRSADSRNHTLTKIFRFLA